MMGPKRLGAREPNLQRVYNCELTALQWALNSAVECHLHTLANDLPTIDSKDVRSG